MKRIGIAAILLGALVLGAFGYEGSLVFQGGLGAKALSMGGAFCALADDGTAALWNPAGILAFGENAWIGGATSQLFGLVPYQYVGGGFSFAGYGIGLGWANATAGDFYTANAFIGTVAVKLGDFGWIGANLKYLLEKITREYTGFGFDLGLIVPVTPELTLGVVAKDLGTTLAGQTVSPLYAVGFAGKLLEGALLLATDVELTGAFAVKNLRVGLGFQLLENLGIRAGLVVPELDFEAYYVTVGAGFSLGGLAVDAAYVLSPEPGESLVLSATFLFGELFAAEKQPVTPR
ncbi:MAG: hypothetical protein ACUVQS_05025 [Candidatus Bipolaricaulaceae bacterium]